MHTCVDTDGSYECSCDIGYDLNDDEHTCSGYYFCITLIYLQIKYKRSFADFVLFNITYKYTNFHIYNLYTKYHRHIHFFSLGYSTHMCIERTCQDMYKKTYKHMVNICFLQRFLNIFCYCWWSVWEGIGQFFCKVNKKKHCILFLTSSKMTIFFSWTRLKYLRFKKILLASKTLFDGYFLEGEKERGIRGSEQKKMI